MTYDPGDERSKRYFNYSKAQKVLIKLREEKDSLQCTIDETVRRSAEAPFGEMAEVWLNALHLLLVERDTLKQGICIQEQLVNYALRALSDGFDELLDAYEKLEQS